MNLHSLKPAKGSVKSNQRRGRGQGSGMGGTATRGHKGAQSRSGYSVKVGFEGGQMPLQRRLPKFGFNNINRKSYKAVNLVDLQKIAEESKVSIINLELLQKNGLVSKKDLVKVLGNGELKASIEVQANAFSTSAKEAIEKVGGKAVII
ncbi:MAG: 50S ribosomal protein L15 [Cytophagia bacterium]|nr:MAG: 50S ribosomal protein L15 [Cytophagales bacterium]TAG04847.1 MAG: 50S ribosomal protein L15 [Cytophagia bacterium]TAG43580.1 MAG: 50S ribosomal protein L15 [Cytophagia bacterium]TAH30195.1 MAG: 50S ribosomal protein L15 [Cytophagales bacterium]